MPVSNYNFVPYLNLFFLISLKIDIVVLGELSSTTRISSFNSFPLKIASTLVMIFLIFAASLNVGIITVRSFAFNEINEGLW
jgi:hypothetical protein